MKANASLHIPLALSHNFVGLFFKTFCYQRNVAFLSCWFLLLVHLKSNRYRRFRTTLSIFQLPSPWLLSRSGPALSPFYTPSPLCLLTCSLSSPSPGLPLLAQLSFSAGFPSQWEQLAKELHIYTGNAH